MANNTGKPGCLGILMVLLALIISTAGAVRPVVKTIQISNGDTIDCVDIYKQPALDHPLLKNHTITPNLFDRSNYTSAHYAEIICQECQSCPERTIPILRMKMKGTVYPVRPHADRMEAVYAKMVNSGFNSWYGGLSADISIWKPIVPAGEDYSSGQIGVEDQYSQVALYAGWAVFPSLFGDFEPRSIVSWLVRNGNHTRGCYNLVCPGFVQVDSSFVLGGRLPVSTPGTETLKKISVRIQKYTSKRRWSVFFNDVHVGYWTYTFLDKFSKAKVVVWAGRVTNKGSGPEARTQMGSGHFPSNGFGIAAHFGTMKYAHKSGRVYDATKLQMVARIPHCYDLILHSQTPISGGPMVTYGGPGGPQCY